ncbi:MAG: hypothetical protein K6G67_05330 [Lachnospiraceae bacterium]|jgi:hypothetical protein|nr:hypothetical protein [Lachnospiraceae bacterium]
MFADIVTVVSKRMEAWGYRMGTIEEQKNEALKTVAEYLEKLIPAMENVIAEIKGEMQEDTVDFLLQVIDGLNFVIETYNVTRDVVNDPEPLINDDQLEKAVGVLSEGFSKKDYPAIADELSGDIVPFLKVFKAAADKIA